MIWSLLLIAVRHRRLRRPELPPVLYSPQVKISTHGHRKYLLSLVQGEAVRAVLGETVELRCTVLGYRYQMQMLGVQYIFIICINISMN